MTRSFPAADKSFRGIWPALLTPLTAGLDIDHAKFAAHCKTLIATGCPGVTAFGTTGEGPSFSLQERKDAIDQLIKNGIPAAQIMVSTSCAALPETLELTRHAVKAGVHGCLMLPPFFLKGVSDQGIIDGYRYVIDGMAGTPFKMYLYHIPQVTGVPLSHHVISTLKKQYPDTIVGIKDSACSTEHSVGLANAFMKDMTVYVGFEPDLPEMGRRGSTGAISGLANFMPRLVKRLVTEPEAAATPAERERVVQLIGLLNGYSLMPALKGIMAMLSGDKAWLRVRAPLVALTADEYQALEKTIAAFGIDTKSD
ncbi:MULTISPECIES: dihydrodipicolinate synthase family protein [unclassified Polaromonas]|uniref:dihydrodipicolinate synthase family protein n=1 Tax=unclassified Polaromonas TaxID=2638319 RepID=UPI000F099259|nr:MULTISPECIES: dihydrodipicolinate synthase family protein [unclassified Polaromonas]AYQ29275.1 dihydrodipicolinate synthase family protein [Polaromonas sp. SP1]QGJ19612.1 dihydrodipicolinate synthase family protein [Polaromonas sp. Pch-P]